MFRRGIFVMKKWSFEIFFYLVDMGNDNELDFEDSFRNNNSFIFMFFW